MKKTTYKIGAEFESHGKQLLQFIAIHQANLSIGGSIYLLVDI